MENREFEVSTPLAAEAKEYLIKNCHLDYSAYDIIIGYRADDSYFRFPESFVRSEITLESLEKIFQAGDLGKQYPFLGFNTTKFGI